MTGEQLQAASNRKKLILYTILEIICLFVLCIVGNLFDFLNLGWTLDKIATWDYWRGVVQQFILYSCSMILGYLSTLEKEDMKNKEYFQIMAKYRELLQSKKQSFTVFIETYFNPNTKKHFIFLANQKKLYKLDRHSKDKWKIDYNKACKEYPDDILKYPVYSTWDSFFQHIDHLRSRRYAIKRRELEKLVSQEYIEENWEMISVRYPYVHAESFTENLSIHYTSDTEYKIDNTATKDIAKMIPLKAVITMLWAVVLACIVYSPDIGQLGNQISMWVTIILKYVIRVAMMLINFAVGLYNAKKVFRENYILPIQNRNRILLEYITWCHDTKQEDTFADKVLAAYRAREEQIEKLNKSKKDLEEALNKAEKKV